MECQCQPVRCAGVTPVSLAGGATVVIETLDCSGNVTSTTTGVPAPPNGSSFWGVICPAADIAGLRIFDPANGAEGQSDVMGVLIQDEPGLACGFLNFAVP